MKYLGIEQEQLKVQGALFTASEIAFQPELWGLVNKLFGKKEKEIKAFLEEALKDCHKIYLTGAGTSAYIGLSLRGSFQRHLMVNSESIATTDLVTHPQDYFLKEEPVVLVSFARSGNSPESVAAAQLADKYSKKCYHLIVTCDATGELAGFKTSNPKLVLVLPAESNDKSLAMTGSYSGMLLAGLLIANINRLDAAGKQVQIISDYGQKILTEYLPALRDIASKGFERAVFLGSGPLFGTAKESQLKLQELTDGKVICKSETYLGFRHGPKAVVDPTTLVCYIVSNDAHVQDYESDLITAMKKGRKPMFEIAVSEDYSRNKKFDLHVKLSSDGEQLEEEFLSVCCILPGQILAFFKSLQLGLKPDSPSKSGAISRVVEGVKIYNN